MADRSTQVAHPWRASLRTAGVHAIVILAALAAIGPEVVSFVEEQFPGSPAGGIVAGASSFIVGLSLLLNRLILLAPVAKAFDKLGLGPAPKESGIE